MTDRHCGYLVTLAEDVREDDGRSIVAALRMIRGVVDVQPVEADPMVETMLKGRIRNNLFVAMRDHLFTACEHCGGVGFLGSGACSVCKGSGKRT